MPTQRVRVRISTHGFRAFTTVIGDQARVHRNERDHEVRQFGLREAKAFAFVRKMERRVARGCPFPLSSGETGEPNQRGLYANCGSGYLRPAHLNGRWKGSSSNSSSSSSSFLPWQRPAVSLNKTSLARNSSLCAPRG